MDALHAVIDFAAGPEGLEPLRLAFGVPQRELVAWSPQEVRATLSEVDALARSGFWCVGHLRYEAARAFEAGVALHEADGPLAHFSVHERTADLPDFSREPSEKPDWVRQVSRAEFGAGMRDAGLDCYNHDLDSAPEFWVRLSAGLQQMGEAVQALCFQAGANSIFYGDKLLTTGNPDAEADLALLRRLGLRAGQPQPRTEAA